MAVTDRTGGGGGPWVDLDRARERFLDGGVLPVAGVRAEIAASWERSRLAGIDATQFRVPYVDDLDFDGSLASCARPVLDDLAEKLSGCAVAVVLTDADGHLLDRRVGEDELARRLDAISLAPGFNYAEQFAGTNGVGTTLSDGAPSLVVGAEHFTDRLQPFACAGAPVQRADGELAGILDITCPRDQAGDLMRVLARQAALDISEALCARGSAGARAVMAAFRTACARHDGPVLAVGTRSRGGLGSAGTDDFVIANGVARRGLTATDHDMLAARAVERLEHGFRAGAEERVLLTEGPARLLFTPVPPARPAGVIVVVARSTSTLRLAPGAPGAPGSTGATPSHPTPPRPAAARPLSGLAGGSAAWRSVGAALRAAAVDRRPVTVSGEPGVGKTAAVRAVHDETRPGARWVVVDGVGVEGATALASLPRVLGDRAATVVVRGLGVPDRERDEALADLLEDVPARWWVVGVATGEAGVVRCGHLGAHDPATVVVDPLRRRPDDVPALVTLWLTRLAPERRLRCSPEVIALLVGARWPGNVRELVEVLRGAVAAVVARAGGVIEPVDLPAELTRHGTRRRLSPLEAAERDLIVEALVEAGGNRVRAAEALGMGRTTLYRRLRAFGLADVGR